MVVFTTARDYTDYTRLIKILYFPGNTLSEV